MYLSIDLSIYLNRSIVVLDVHDVLTVLDVLCLLYVSVVGDPLI